MAAATSVEDHSGEAGSVGAILEGLRSSGAQMEDLGVDDLAPVDHFHTRGKAATVELLQRASIDAAARVLDLGGGLGGAARLLASAVGGRVAVLDLTDVYVRVGRDLTRRVGLGDRVTFVRGDALATPFRDDEFDVVWMQHASMNIADKLPSTGRSAACCAVAAGLRCTRRGPGRYNPSTFR